LPITAASWDVDQADLSLFDGPNAPARPTGQILKTTSLSDQYGQQHGRAIALWMDEAHDRQTYFIKDLLRNRYCMERSDWVHSPDGWYETWMGWENTVSTPEWPP